MRNLASVTILFFGSTSDSVLVLDKLAPLVCTVVTQPARPVGRKRILTPTPVEQWARAHSLPVISFASNTQKPWLYENEQQVTDALRACGANLLVSAAYGQKIPWDAICAARFGGLNIHPSLLPRWRGADPVPWAILCGDRQTGVTVVTLSRQFDRGRIVAQEVVPIADTDTSGPLRTKLFTIGRDLLMDVLPAYLAAPATYARAGTEVKGGESYARRLTRDDGFEPWDAVQRAFDDPGEAERIDRKFRAFHPWPGLWTKIAGKRLKILDLSRQSGLLVIRQVQREGKRPVPWEQFQQAYLPS